MGFLSGLSNLAGGAMGGLRNAGSGLLDNMLPGAVTQTAGADLGAVPQGLPGAGEQLTGAPTIQKHGLLERMGTPDARGMNMGDKLMAASLMMQGDTGGAADFMRQQRSANDVLQQRQLAQDNAKLGLEALRKNIRPDGSLDMQGYLAALPAGADPKEGIAAAQAGRTKYDYLNTGGGGVVAANPYDRNDLREVVKGTPKAPGPLILRPGGNPDDPSDWIPNANYMAAQEGVSAAKRRGAPLAPRAGRAGGKAKSYGQDEVTW